MRMGIDALCKAGDNSYVMLDEFIGDGLRPALALVSRPASPDDGDEPLRS